MAQLTRAEEIQVLESAGINVQRARGGINYLEAIWEDSPVLHDAASLVYGLMEKYAALDGLVRHGFRTPQSASDEFVSQLSMARQDARKWGEKKAGDREVDYASRRLDEVITGVLKKCGAESAYRF